MKLSDKQIELKLCETYFLFITKFMTSEVSLEKLCSLSKISLDRAKKIIPDDYSSHFLKLFITNVDKETLDQLENEIKDDVISTIYDKILEGITVRFEKLSKYKIALQILSRNFDQRVNIFFNLFKENYCFMTKLLNLVDPSQNCFIKNAKSIALNIVFIRGLDNFLKVEENDIDSTLRILDKNLTEIEDLGYLLGVVKK